MAHENDDELTLDTPNTAYSKSYAIVVSLKTFNDAGWNRVVVHLYSLHPNATVLIYGEKGLRTIRFRLREEMPRYVAFICQPTECGRTFVAKCHRLMRSLDRSPFIDAMWSIVTGSNPNCALAAIDNKRVEQPFIIRRAITFTNIDQDLFETCFTFSDGVKGCWFGKNCFVNDHHGHAKDRGHFYPRAPAEIFVEKFFGIEPDLLVTSGHGTEDSIEMPWSDGKLLVTDNGLVPLDKDKSPVASALKQSVNPKVFMAIGNCLVGHCTGSSCMVTTFLGRLGVRQMCGYTVKTWFGRAGWGLLDLWKSVPGRLSLSDAFFLHQVQMAEELRSLDSRLIHFQFDVADGDPSDKTVIAQIDDQFEFDDDRDDDSQTKNKIYGLCYDRDTFVFYGDPAFIAKLNQTESSSSVRTKLLRTGLNSHQFVIEFNDQQTAQTYHLPIGSIFTNRIKNFSIITGFEFQPILSDNFIIVLKPNPKQKHIQIIRIDFQATIIQKKVRGELSDGF